MTSGEPDGPAIRTPSFAFERVIGASHLRTGKPCQDEVGVLVAGQSFALAVADGHGSSKHAEVGARLAVQVTLPALVRFAEDLGTRSSNLAEVQRYAEHPLRVQIVREWAARVRGKAGTDEVALLDYGSTLLFALATPSFLMLGQLGDGDVLLVEGDGTTRTPLPADPTAFADETPSLCQHEAWQALRVLVLPPPADESLLLISTDGYSKSYATDAVFHQVGPDYLDLVRADGLSALQPHLRGFLEQVTTQGSGDDIALGLLYWAPADPGEAREAEGASVEVPDPDEAAAGHDEPMDTDVDEEIELDPGALDAGDGMAQEASSPTEADGQAIGEQTEEPQEHEGEDERADQSV